MKIWRLLILHKSWLAPMVRVGVALVIAFLLTRVPMEYLEAWTYDLRVKTKALTPPSGKLVLIAIDPLTIEGLKRDPNAMDHVRLLNALTMSRPRAVVYVQSPNDLDGSSEDLKAFAQAAKNLDHFFVVANQIPMRGQEDQLRLEPPLQSLRVVPGPKTSDSSEPVRITLIFDPQEPTNHCHLLKFSRAHILPISFTIRSFLLEPIPSCLPRIIYALHFRETSSR
ncbi:MAG: CHASE2 domain-containing protein [Bdellovibrionales bacterium]|nr:CHASE2 domain-containing protein [Bdellovibrionales bacterium]